jgi:hypothetical protein
MLNLIKIRANVLVTVNRMEGPGSNPGRGKGLLFKKLPERLWAHPVSYSMLTGFPPPGEEAGCEFDHSHLTVTEVKKEWSYTCLPHTPSWF